MTVIQKNICLVERVKLPIILMMFSCVWLVENGAYICFELIESRFDGIDLNRVQESKDRQKTLVKSVTEDNLQARIELSSHIEAIIHSASAPENVDIKGIRKNREKKSRRIIWIM